MSADGPPRGARPLLSEGVREAASAASLGEALLPSAEGPPRGACHSFGKGVREAASAASLGEAFS